MVEFSSLIDHLIASGFPIHVSHLTAWPLLRVRQPTVHWRMLPQLDVSQLYEKTH
jgi:hypothetical protein